MATADDAARTAAPAGSGGRDHVVLFPFMAKGHTLPLLHLATALSAHHGAGGGGLRVTVLTTPGNLAFARRRVPADVDLVALPFPAHPELPEGVESTDALPSHALFAAFLRATALLQEPFTGYLASLPAPPLALVSDFFLGFTQRVASDAGVRRLTFHGMSAFSLALCFSLARRPHPPADESVIEDGGPFRVPGFPETVTITKDEVPHAVAQASDVDDPVTRFLFDEVRDWDYRSWGVLVNSFDALDGDYAAILESFYLPGARAWLVGPLFLAAGESQEEDGEDDPEGCLPWLDERAAKRPGSVVYVSFGTQVHVTAAQLDELAHGLVASGHAFLWAVRSSDAWSPPVDVGTEGKIVRGWVPQRRVLAHPAVGGFVSHCGWNSVLESLATGQPMLAWPVMAEQAANAKHVADILGAGVRMGVKAGANAAPELVGRAHVAGKVRELMDDGQTGRRMRASAEHVRKATRAAVGEGGTSRLALRRLVDELQRSYDGGRRGDE
ncbi:UDP-glycosyltransferase 73B5 [Dichanthelium oligosanthes]|uniref:Glycosyltransferase n=1 Tax=Dichanthelium oligosanthes TaxID=888268 RepID=A0A1E5VGY6_9POAL|nr:UDP-glycosyltransferase 73B5 [Dichanthelium oligosanthes]